VIYGQGSLYTSIVPCLILPGVGEAVSQVSGRKILILNGSYDRETHDMTATDFVHAITNALNRFVLTMMIMPLRLARIIDSHYQLLFDVTNRYGDLKQPVGSYIDTLVVSRTSEIECNVPDLARLGIRVVYVDGDPASSKPFVYDERKLVTTLMDITTRNHS
jgi:hypothetical protein